MSSFTPGLLQRLRAAPAGRACLVADGRALSYGELRRRADRIATAFAARGWAPGTRLAIVTRHDAYALCALVGALQAGLVPLVADAEARATEALTLLAVAKIEALIVDEELTATWLPEPQGLPAWPLPKPGRDGGALYQRLLGRKAAPADWFATLDALPEPAATVLPASGRMLFFTSGSTATSKTVELGLEAIEAHLATLQRQHGYDADSRLLNLLPWNHVDGLIQGAFNALWSQATLHRPMRFRIDTVQRLLDTLYAERITHFVAVPTMLAIILRLADALKDAFTAPELRMVISTAGYLEAALWQRFETRFGVTVCNVYGLTETVAGGLFSGPDAATRRLGTLGKPVDCAARIVDAEGREAAAGATGELWLQGANLMTGYFGNPEATATVLRDGWLRTGDRVHADAEGFIVFDGRIKNTLVSGGHNIQPEEITTVLKTFAGVADAATLGMPHAELEEVPVGVVVAAEGRTIDLAALDAHCRAALADYKLPRTIVVLPALPLGPSGKVRTAALRELVVAHLDTPRGVAGQGVEAQVMALAASCFGGSALSPASTPDVTPGWDSIAHLEFVMALERRFGIELLPRHIIALTSLGAAVGIVQSILDE